MIPSSLPVDDILEALDLSRAEPGLGFLAALFERFNAKVPFENVSKIVRDAAVEDRREKPRRPPLFWADHLERGTGGTCFARVAALDALLEALGFSTRKVLGRVERDFDHAALRVSHGGEDWICDVGFPLPALLPRAPGRIETAILDMDVASTTRGHAIEFVSGVPEGPRGLEIFEREVPEEEFLERWQATFASGSRFLSEVALRRQDPTRVVSFARGEVRVDDRHSRLRVPLAAPRAPRLSELFGVDAGLCAEALSRAGDREPPDRGGGLTAYLEAPASPAAAFAAVSGPGGYRRWLEGVAEVTVLEEGASGWRLALAPPAAATGPSASLTEEVTPVPERLALKIRRTAGARRFDSELKAETRAGRTYLVREAFFEAPREDLLRNDSLRGRLAGTLAVDLLAWARLLTSES